jgi:hypothetical protein
MGIRQFLAAAIFVTFLTSSVASKEVVLSCSAVAEQATTQKGDLKEVAKEARTLFGQLMAAALTARNLPAAHKKVIGQWCKEGRFRYNAAKNQTVVHDGAFVVDRIVLGTDVPVDPSSRIDWKFRGTCMSLKGLGDPVFHETTHLLSESEHDIENGQDGWTGAWGNCIAGRVLADYAARRPKVAKLCGKSFAVMVKQNCKMKNLLAPEGFTPPDDWPFYLAIDAAPHHRNKAPNTEKR